MSAAALHAGGGAELIVIALGLMPLAGAVAINFSSPLFATLFAALWLKEKVGLARGAGAGRRLCRRAAGGLARRR